MNPFSEHQSPSRPAEIEGFRPPTTFADFYLRYPNAIKSRLRGKWRLKNSDLEDSEHDVCIHLLSLSTGSIFRGKGCVDRIATYDPAKRGGGSEKLFLAYINLIIDNFCLSNFRRSANQLISRSAMIASLIDPDLTGDGIDEETAAARLSDAFRVNDDPIPQIYWTQFLQKASRVHPLIVTVAIALVQHRSKREAAARLNMTPSRFEYVVRAVRAFALDDHETLRGFRKLRRPLVPATVFCSK